MSYVTQLRDAIRDHKEEINEEICESDDFLFVLGSYGDKMFTADMGNPGHLSNAIRKLTEDQLLMLVRLFLPLQDNLMDYLIKELEKKKDEF